MKSRVSVFAPATCANVAVGFDVLGFAIASVGDELTATFTNDHRITIQVTGDAEGSSAIPTSVDSNTAGVAFRAVMRRAGDSRGFHLRVKKGIPVGSGMGGSAASAVAGALAANALLDHPLEDKTILEMAVQGEFVASGSSHADNAAPCLLGGLTLVLHDDAAGFRVLSLPVPSGLSYAVVRPHQRLETRTARSILNTELPLGLHVKQSANFAAFVHALHSGDFELMRHVLRDELIEPQRKVLIPGFDAVKAAALSSGALGSSISGAGPSVFGLFPSDEMAHSARASMVAAFAALGIDSDGYSGTIDPRGARVTSEG